jgi:hypothetical protein
VRIGPVEGVDRRQHGAQQQSDPPCTASVPTLIADDSIATMVVVVAVVVAVAVVVVVESDEDGSAQCTNLGADLCAFEDAEAHAFEATEAGGERDTGCCELRGDSAEGGEW